MKPLSAIAVCCAALPLSISAVHARPAAPSAVQATIQKLYDRENAAVAAKDVKAVFSLRTPDYEAVSSRGQKRTASQLRQIYGQMFAQTRSLKGVSRVQSLALHGQTAQVKVSEVATIALTDPRTGHDAVMKISQISLDDWVQRNGRWLKRRSRALSAKTTFNGKPLRAPG